MYKTARFSKVVVFLIFLSLTAGVFSAYAIERKIKYLPRNETVLQRKLPSINLILTPTNVGDPNCIVSGNLIGDQRCNNCVSLLQSCPLCCFGTLCPSAPTLRFVSEQSVQNRRVFPALPPDDARTFLNDRSANRACCDNGSGGNTCSAAVLGFDLSIEYGPDRNPVAAPRALFSCTNSINAAFCGFEERACPVPQPNATTRLCDLVPDGNLYYCRSNVDGLGNPIQPRRNLMVNINTNPVFNSLRSVCNATTLADPVAVRVDDPVVCNSHFIQDPPNLPIAMPAPCYTYDYTNYFNCSRACASETRQFETDLNQVYCQGQSCCNGAITCAPTETLQSRCGNNPTACTNLSAMLCTNVGTAVNPLRCQDATAVECNNRFGGASDCLNDKSATSTCFGCFEDIRETQLKFVSRGSEAVTIIWSMDVGFGGATLPPNTTLPFFSKIRIYKAGRGMTIIDSIPVFQSTVHQKEITANFSIWFSSYVEKRFLEAGVPYIIVLSYYYPNMGVTLTMSGVQMTVIKSKE